MQLKVVSYNIQGHAASRRADHIPKIAETIAALSPDIIGLQEVHCRTKASPNVHQAEQIAKFTGLNVYFGKSCAMDGGDYEHLADNGELFPHVLFGDAKMLFYVTHLAAWGRLLRNARLSQVATLGDITARGSDPHVLVGDFNVPPSAEEMRVLQSHGHLRIAGDTREPTFPMTRQRLDYVFCDPRWEFVSGEVVRRGPSDHWPLVAQLVLRA